MMNGSDTCLRKALSEDFISSNGSPIVPSTPPTFMFAAQLSKEDICTQHKEVSFDVTAPSSAAVNISLMVHERSSMSMSFPITACMPIYCTLQWMLIFNL